MTELSSQLSSATLASAGSGSGSGSGGHGDSSNGKDGSAPSVGRGATRGRRDRADELLMRTRPETLQSKQGEGGTEINVASNYFELIAK